MKARWLLAAVAAMPFAVGVLALQSCGGEGGPVGGGGGVGGETGLVAQFKALWTDSQKAGATYVGSDTCGATGCHGNRAETIYEEWSHTKHYGENVGCESCHGPGSAHVASQSEDDILTSPRVTKPVVCGQCHGPLYNDYLQSGHKQIIAHPVEDGISNPSQYGVTSRCMACHGGLYRIEIYEKGLNPADPNQVPLTRISEIAEENVTEVPHIAMCATCHNPHAKMGNLNKEGEDVQLRHLAHNEDPTPILPGTTAASFTTFNQICGQCHNGRGADGRDPKLLSSTSRPNMHDSNQFNMLAGRGGAEGPSGPVQRNMAHFSAEGQCSKCHMPNARHSFTVSYDTSCVPCHTPADAAARKAQLESEMLNRLFVLRTRMENWVMANYNDSMPGYTSGEMSGLLFRFLWDYSSNITTAGTELGLDMNNAANTPPSTHQASLPIELMRARHNYYFVLRDSSICPHNPPYARYLMDYANEQMDILFGSRPEKAPPKLTLEQKKAIIKADTARAKRADREAMLNGEGD